MKWFEAGVENRAVLDLILLNMRFPRAQRGDFRAQLASCITADQRCGRSSPRHGRETVAAAMTATKDRSERLMRAAIAEVPDGDYRFENLADDDGTVRRPTASRSRSGCAATRRPSTSRARARRR